jgi:hypothetical protein
LFASRRRPAVVARGECVLAVLRNRTVTDCRESCPVVGAMAGATLVR